MPVLAEEEAAGVAAEEAGAEVAAALADADVVAAAAPRVTVIIFVETTQLETGAMVATLALEAELTAATGATLALALTATLPLEAPPGVPTVPSTALVVKLEKPAATMTSATDIPVLLSCVVSEAAELAFSLSEPVTAGSMRGTIPRRSGLTGREVSLQIEGTETTKGLKFCSAATRPRAAATASAPSPSWVRMRSAWVSFPHGLAAASKKLID